MRDYSEFLRKRFTKYWNHSPKQYCAGNISVRGEA
jgi:hypothetical protein